MNRSFRIMASYTVLAVVGLTLAPRLSAQTPIDCSYDECALRIKQSLFSQQIVRGLDDERVAGLGMFTGSLDGTFAGNTLAQDLAASYRRRHNTGVVVVLIGVVAMVVGLSTYDSGPFGSDNGADVALLGGSILTLTGALIERSGQDRLHRAVWEYNRGLGR